VIASKRLGPKMAKVPFKWAEEAEKNFTETVDYILSNFGVEVALHFIDKVDAIIELIRINHNLFPKIEKNLHRCVISYQSSLTYTMVEGIIYIVSFYANRTNHRFYLE
jgi:plasmid stabilization system protein ParE